MFRRILMGTLVALPVAFGATSALADDAVAKDQASRYATANVQRGKFLFMQCRGCHEVSPEQSEADQLLKVGPNLYGVVGRTAGTAPGFQGYSDAMKKSGIVWTPEKLEAFIERPGALVPGTRMAFAGITSEKDRIDLMAYLLEVSRPLDK